MMLRTTRPILALTLLAATTTTHARQGDDATRTVETDRRAVLVELYTSQGCNFCPTAEKVIALMESKDAGGDRIVPLSFHVDYFNTPWEDPFSERLYSGRQYTYHQKWKERNPDEPDLYFTPLIMVDGRYPMSGYNKEGVAPVWPLLEARLKRALSADLEARLTLTLAEGEAPNSRTLTVAARPESRKLVGRDLLIGVAVAEGPLSTAVPSGENAGATLVEDHVVRRFLAETVTLARSEAAEATFDLELGEGWDPSHCDVVAFLQDPETGFVYQAASISWTPRQRR